MLIMHPLFFVFAWSVVYGYTTCDSGWAFDSSSQKCYRRFDRRTWTSCYDLCASVRYGSRMLCVENAGENAVVRSIAGNGNSDPMWLGYTDRNIEGRWEWVAGCFSSYSNWQNGEPNNAGDQDYAAIYGYLDTWDDKSNSGTDRYLHVSPWCGCEYSYPSIPPPSPFPTPMPSPTPTFSPTLHPTSTPTLHPTSFPTLHPTSSPTPYPTSPPTLHPTSTPTLHPTSTPTLHPTSTPTLHPTSSPTVYPTSSPTLYPTSSPTLHPTSSPTLYPTSSPTLYPTSTPTPFPTSSPTLYPTSSPTLNPTSSPTLHPTSSPTLYPTSSPTLYPTSTPTPFPISLPSLAPPFESSRPSCVPTINPTLQSTVSSTYYPTRSPSLCHGAAIVITSFIPDADLVYVGESILVRWIAQPCYKIKWIGFELLSQSPYGNKSNHVPILDMREYYVASHGKCELKVERAPPSDLRYFTLRIFDYENRTTGVQSSIFEIAFRSDSETYGDDDAEGAESIHTKISWVIRTLVGVVLCWACIIAYVKHTCRKALSQTTILLLITSLVATWLEVELIIVLWISAKQFALFLFCHRLGTFVYQALIIVQLVASTQRLWKDIFELLQHSSFYSIILLLSCVDLEFLLLLPWRYKEKRHFVGFSCVQLFGRVMLRHISDFGELLIKSYLFALGIEPSVLVSMTLAACIVYISISTLIKLHHLYRHRALSPYQSLLEKYQILMRDSEVLPDCLQLSKTRSSTIVPSLHNPRRAQRNEDYDDPFCFSGDEEAPVHDDHKKKRKKVNVLPLAECIAQPISTSEVPTALVHLGYSHTGSISVDLT